MSADVWVSPEELLVGQGEGTSWSAAHPRRGVLAGALRTRRGHVGATLALAVVLVACLGPIFARSSTQFVTTPFAGPSSSHLFGGDNLGRDALSRTLNGGWELLVMAAAATALGVACGTALGAIAAFRGGWRDHMIMRAADVVLAFPQLVFALLLVSIVGPKVWLIVVAVAIGHAPQVARVIRAAALDVCERDFVSSAELIALPRRQILLKEIIPNLTGPLMVEAGLRLTYSIVIIAGLSFLGFGLQPPAPSWGVMINENRIGLAANPWPVIVPAVLLMVLTVGMNIFTDAIARVALGLDRGGLRKARRGARAGTRAAATEVS
jgi:peptide/nickel transport system permease protein